MDITFDRKKTNYFQTNDLVLSDTNLEFYIQNNNKKANCA